MQSAAQVTVTPILPLQKEKYKNVSVCVCCCLLVYVSLDILPECDQIIECVTL